MPAKKEPKKMDSRVLAVAAFLIVVVGGAIAAFAYIAAGNKTVYIDKAQVTAPMITLSPSASGVLKEVDVSEGDTVLPNTVVAVVGTQLIKTTSGGLVITVNNNIGKLVNPGDSVVEMIDPTELRVVGELPENKGLANVQPGQRATFTVDAFGGQQFSGIVDEVAPTAKSSDVVFSVSDQREEQNFDIKIRYDQTQYPQLKNGMSTKIWVYKQ